MSTEINIVSPSDSVIVDSGGASPVFSFSSSPSDDEPDEANSTCPSSVAAGEPSGGRAASLAFCMSVPDEAVDASLNLGLGEPSTQPQSVDVGCLFRDSVASRPDVPTVVSHYRSVKFVYKCKIGHLVTSAILRFLNSAIMLKEWNNTLIVLISKVDKPELVSQYRPISLCNVVYRLASKCLANRLKLVIPSLISDSQQVFVPGHLMSDGCLIAHEIMHYLNKTKKGTKFYSVLKLDMHKAFDRVSWHFLMSVLERFGFPTTWCNLIWATPSSFEVLRDIFQSFEATSGQMINLDKSFVKFSPNSPDDFKPHMTSILRMKDSSIFGTYLGVPVDLPKQKTTAFQGLIDKLKSCVSSWSSLHLSQSSKLVIINSILLGSMAHILAAIPLPLAISRKLDSLIFAFWWSKDTKRRSIHWLSQQHLHALKDNGGLGIKSVTILGQVTLMKKIWCLHHKPARLLAKYLAPKYRKDLPIPGLKSKVTQPSYVWKGVCRAVASCAPALVWKVGSTTDLEAAPPPLVPTISELVLDNGSWNPWIIYNLFAQSTAKDILAMKPPILAPDNFLYWKYTEDGSYNVRSGLILPAFFVGVALKILAIYSALAMLFNMSDIVLCLAYNPLPTQKSLSSAG
ncbi:uncharacterized protein LOC141595457 [Silene latifolia]|uniref:uncharacterized protein LOC141595457 n=1 Tax=Silene latifolia TaxID=37657 RepID=UPI003D76C03F